MKDRYVSGSTVITEAFWVLATAMVATTWLLALANVQHRWEAATAVTAVFCMAGAITMQFRLYVLRLCSLIRVSNGLESPDARLHRIHSESTR